MSSSDDLPIILVSAANESAAVKIISDIIDNEVTEVHCDENISPHRVWKIANKYYTADVCLRPFTDDEPALTQLNNIEAHIIYLTEDECAGSEDSIVQLCETRVQRVGTAGRHAHVHLVAAECSTLPAPLITTAMRLHFEPVPLRSEPSQSHGDEEEEEEYGLPRVRAALHAHTWSGLKLSAAAAVPSSPLTFRELSRSVTSSESEGGGGGGSGDEEEAGAEEGAVERAEAFAEALGALRGAAAECAALRGAERSRRAELLLAEFCRALGHRLDSY